MKENEDQCQPNLRANPVQGSIPALELLSVATVILTCSEGSAHQCQIIERPLRMSLVCTVTVTMTVTVTVPLCCVVGP